jgi:hypothetical protein
MRHQGTGDDSVLRHQGTNWRHQGTNGLWTATRPGAEGRHPAGVTRVRIGALRRGRSLVAVGMAKAPCGFVLC